MKNQSLLNEIQERLQHLNGFDHALAPDDFLISTRKQNQLLVQEQGDEADLAICLQQQLLEKFRDKKFPDDFNLEVYPELATIVEELSHFNYYCERATQSRQVSPLELEVQGEVDKFGFALECLQARNETALRDEVFDVLFERHSFQPTLTSQEKQIYQEAHDIARAFCRRVLRALDHEEEYRSHFQNFFQLSNQDKLSLKF